MTKLSVNLNKVALLRNSRAWDYPSVAEAARVALRAGAAGVTVHPRPDERHIRGSDVGVLAQVIKDEALRGDNLRGEFNIEGNPFEGRFLEHVEQHRPTQATFVPDLPGQSTSDHGWDLRDASVVARLQPVVSRVRSWGVRVSLFVEADPAVMAPARAAGADRVELYTEAFATAHGTLAQDATLNRFAAAASAAQQRGLAVNAGHDLTLENLPTLLTIPGIAEVSIGHALIADAVFMGLSDAVKAYLSVCRSGR